MNDIFKHLLTGKDNTTYDIARVTWLIGFVAIIAFAVFEVINNSPVSVRDLAESLGIVSASGGAAAAMKGKTEPDAN